MWFRLSRLPSSNLHPPGNSYTITFKPDAISFLPLAEYVPVLFVLFPFSSKFFYIPRCIEAKHFYPQNMGSPAKNETKLQK